MADKKSKFPPITEIQVNVLFAVMAWREAEVTLEEGFKGATCSGPERFWMGERHRTKEELMKACAKLAQEEAELFGRAKLKQHDEIHGGSE